MKAFFFHSVLLRRGAGGGKILYNVSSLERNILNVNQMIKPDNWHHAGHLPSVKRLELIGTNGVVLFRGLY